MRINYECTAHSSNITELNAHGCYIDANEDECRHTVKFQTPVNVNQIWKDFPMSYTLNKDNLCIEVTESFSGNAALLCPISYLRNDTELRLVVECVKGIVELLTILDENGWALIGAGKKLISHKQICNVIMNVRSDGSVVQTHKYLLTKKSKNCLSLLPKAILYFLCRETKTTQDSCSLIDCRLKKQQSYFLQFPEELLHRCFCGPVDSGKCNDFQRNNIMDIFTNI